MRWPLQPLQPPQQTQLQPLFGQSVDSLCHPWFTTTNVSYRFPILKLPPPPCAALLVYIYKDPLNGWSMGWFFRKVDVICRAQVVERGTIELWWLEIQRRCAWTARKGNQEDFFPLFVRECCRSAPLLRWSERSETWDFTAWGNVAPINRPMIVALSKL